MEMIEVEGYRIPRDWMDKIDYPEPPDTHWGDLSNENLQMWDRYREELGNWYDKYTLSPCSCSDEDKNHQLCPICDEQKYNDIKTKFDNAITQLFQSDYLEE